MNADKYFGKELADEIRETLAYAKQLDDDEKKVFANSIRNQVQENDIPTAKEVLNKLANIIESEAVAE